MDKYHLILALGQAKVQRLTVIQRDNQGIVELRESDWRTMAQQVARHMAGTCESGDTICIGSIRWGIHPQEYRLIYVSVSN